MPALGRFVVAAALLVPPLAAQTDLVAQGYDHFYNLEYPEAIGDFQRAIALHPNDPELHNHLAQAIVFQEMYRNGALESEARLGQQFLPPAAQAESLAGHRGALPGGGVHGHRPL